MLDRPGMTEITFRSGGSGPPCLLLHAFPLNAAMWSGQIETLRDAATFYAADLPGFGQSPSSVDSAPDLDNMAMLIYRQIQATGVKRAVVVGNSLGGYLAFSLLRLAPAFVRALALINTKASADDDEAKKRRFAVAQRVEREGCRFLIDDWPAGALSPVTMNTKADIVRDVQSMAAKATPKGVIWAQRAMAARPDSTPLLGAIDVPTIVIHGLDDTIVPPAQAQSMARAIPDATFVGVAQAAHLPSLEQPAAVNEALRSFLNQIV